MVLPLASSVRLARPERITVNSVFGRSTTGQLPDAVAITGLLLRGQNRPIEASERAIVPPSEAVPIRRALRSIAAVEALKGIVALAAGLGLIGLLHRDLHHIAASLIGHIGLDPGERYPAMVLRSVDALRSASLRSLLLTVSAYASVRLLEAYGLWRDRTWGKWLGALSGALYVPFEVRHFAYRPTFATAVVIALNVGVVGFLAWQISRERRVVAEAVR
jgi:uncharacterized membrane protein (DUF2068 family)